MSFLFILFLTLSILIIPTVIIGYFLAKKFRKIKLNWIIVFAFATFLSSLFFFIPQYKLEVWQTTNTNGLIHIVKRVGQCFDIFGMSIHNAIRLFIVDTDFSSVNSVVDGVFYNNNVLKYIAELYRIHGVCLYVISPLFTFSFIASFLYDIFSKIVLKTKKDVKLYLFSSLNEKMLALATSIVETEKGKKIKVVFCNVEDKTDPSIKPFLNNAKSIGAYIIKDSLADLDLKNKDQVCFFISGDDEYEKLDLTSNLLDNYPNKENFVIYLFSNTIQSNMLLYNLGKKQEESIKDNKNIANIKLHLINEVKSVVNNEVYKNGKEIFFRAKENNTNILNLVMVGAGEYGTQMFKTLLWYCQVIGYKLNFTLIDADKDTLSRYRAMFPEIDFVDGQNPQKSSGKQPNYNVKIYSGVNVKTDKFYSILSSINNPSFIFVSIGDDEFNLSTGIEIRRQCERDRSNPIIKVSMRSSKIASKIKDAENHKKQRYNIEAIGDINSAYAYDCIICSELEQDALTHHLRKEKVNGALTPEEKAILLTKQSEFWNSAYNYNSSIAQRMHCKLLKDLGIRKEGENYTIKDEITKLEHIRWCAYMRSNGFKYCEIRNDLAKEHTDLVDYELLSDEKKSYDIY